ncbi:hypothetical protein CANINC_001727 [Pichia inconspicua]|uniref:Elongin-A n=1 Tax=Pichia inconspicua TaxID=52247 RepID=A0A4T0X4M2_9ASCO|nr:hypothetical protein CANINC_001727 [[Candida] inconspicua]
MEKQNKGVISLTQLARLKCINNAHLINDIGSTPYHLIEPILVKKTAKSLKQIEEQSPHIIADSENLWKLLISRDFPDRPLTHPISENGRRVNMKSRKLYDKYINDREVQRQNAVGNLKQITKNLNSMKNKNKVKSIDNFLPMKRQRVMTLPKQQSFKSSLLQKARVVHKQRVRHFLQPKPVISQQSSFGMVRLEKSATLATNVKRSFETGPTQAISTKPSKSKTVPQLNTKRPHV